MAFSTFDWEVYLPDLNHSAVTCSASLDAQWTEEWYRGLHFLEAKSDSDKLGRQYLQGWSN